MRSWPAEASPPAFAFMPFLDIVLAVIGILIVVFVLRDTQTQRAGRPLAMDHLILCQQDAQLALYLDPDPERAPQTYGPQQIPALFDALATAGTGVRSLVFAHSGQCFATRHRFEQAFARHNSLLRGDKPTSAGVLRLNYHPLSDDPASASALLERWRGAGVQPHHDTRNE
ncbi:hypothetical protein [Rhabdochromatium marinum]|uniref:hypothetical protein n=1 Tax=Rhabdochromatium marinum TaxID=48729 RepID=UPI00190630AB|nr:hypothetical protein [Rhabdochromatium marinum]MBK1648341.1 hypothetical protein [Rhabdochromatium marinum]